MMIKIDIFKLVEYDCEYVIAFGPWGSKHKSKLGYFVEYELLTKSDEEIAELFPSGTLVDDEHPLAILRQLMADSIESICDAEFKEKRVTGWGPGERQCKEMACEFMPFMHADIRNATIEYNTENGEWRMK